MLNNPFDYQPTQECREAYLQLLSHIESLRHSDLYEDKVLCEELDAGKMLGVLIAEDENGARHTLYAFSGQLGRLGFHHPFFVAPVFDYLRPEGYFKIKEKEISRLSSLIRWAEEHDLYPLLSQYEERRAVADGLISQCKQQYNLSKYHRDLRRRSGSADEGELAAMIRQSQYEKAELKRLKKRHNDDLLPLKVDVDKLKSEIASLKEYRRQESEALQEWLFTNFTLMNAKGEKKNLKDIFSETAFKIPPSGAGECCAPKLLQAAYNMALRPISISEFWYGSPKRGEVRYHGRYYPACRGKCLPVLTWMLQGLDVTPSLNHNEVSELSITPEVIFENELFCVVNKPSGMLSVPGKEQNVSLQQWLMARYGGVKEVMVAHRLDQDTSGLIIASFGPEAYRAMQSLFAERKISKTYEAVLEGDYLASKIPAQGSISLPLMADWLDRPRQRVDFQGGRQAVTEYKFMECRDAKSRVIFQPHTGRTHQLRVHAASIYGLGMPIVGDRLYGDKLITAKSRLMLHAKEIEFTFPLDGRHYHFVINTPF